MFLLENDSVFPGQGVVVVRSAYSDRVMAEAKRRMGWITKNCKYTFNV